MVGGFCTVVPASEVSRLALLKLTVAPLPLVVRVSVTPAQGKVQKRVRLRAMPLVKVISLNSTESWPRATVMVKACVATPSELPVLPALRT